MSNQILFQIDIQSNSKENCFVGFLLYKKEINQDKIILLSRSLIVNWYYNLNTLSFVMYFLGKISNRLYHGFIWNKL